MSKTLTRINMYGLSSGELRILKRLNSPIKIQDYLDAMPLNFEKGGETYMSPRRVLRENKSHCLEGALLAGVALWLQGEKAYLLDCRAPKDEDHVIALYRRNGYWGAISKTNHATLRYRDPVYKTVRELVLSYFHEYTNTKTGKKTLREYSEPFDLKRLGTAWITAEEDLFDVAKTLDELPHKKLVSKKNLGLIRKADPMEFKAGQLIEWTADDPRT